MDFDRQFWTTFFQGRASFRAHVKVLILVLMAFVGLFVAAGMVYSIPFTLTGVCISNLGNPLPSHNPKGWWLFTIAMIGVAPFLMAHARYMYRAFLPTWPIYSRLLYISLVLGSLGMPLVGIINETTWPPHIAVSLIAFGGLGLPAFFSFPLLVRKVIHREPWPNKVALIGLYMIMGGIMVWIGILMSANHFQPPFANQNLSEWLGFTVILFWLIGTFLMTSTDGNSNTPEKR